MLLLVDGALGGHWTERQFSLRWAFGGLTAADWTVSEPVGQREPGGPLQVSYTCALLP